MVTIICDWCQYVGQGESYEEQINDVETHERTCEYNQNLCKSYDSDNVVCSFCIETTLEDRQSNECYKHGG